MRYLLDSNTCIDCIRGRSSVAEMAATLRPDDLVVSSITHYELATGIEKCADPDRQRAKVNLFLNTVHQLNFDLAAALEAARIRAELESRGEMIGPYDVLIAGHARSLGLVLVTANTKEFAKIPGLAIENWRSVGK